MKRYSKFQQQPKRQNLEILGLDQSLEEENLVKNSLQADPIRYQSIQDRKIFQFNDNNDEDDDEIGDRIQIESDKKPDQIKIVYSDSKDKLKLNNFFGSKKQLDRNNKQTIPQSQNPQNISDQFIQDPNKRLALLVQRQIDQKRRWQAQNTLQFEQEFVDAQNPLSFNKMSSKNLLKKINYEKFESKNLQKNLFQNKQEDNFDYIRESNLNKQESTNSIPQKKKQRQLHPLKKKPSTIEVLSQLQSNFTSKLETIRKQSKVYGKRQIQGSQIQDLKIFNIDPIQQTRYLEGQLSRERSGFGKSFFPEYHLYLKDSTHFLSAKKTINGYSIGYSKQLNENSESYLGHIKGNLLGTEYNLYNADEEIISTISFLSQFSTQSITRNIEIYLKSSRFKYSELDRDNPSNDACSLLQLYKQGENMIEKKIFKFINKKPLYIQSTKSYKLDFKGKVTISSVKNTIIIDPERPEQDLLIFGKNGHDSFYLKAEHPFSPLQIMGFLMSSFNFKFLSQ